MARRPLPTLADAVQKVLVKGTENLSQRSRRTIEVFARAIGVQPETFLGYAASTRTKYVRAAKKGRTAAQERERVRQRRRAKSQQPKSGPQFDPRWREVLRNRDELRAEGLDTRAGDNTHTDEIAATDLYSTDSMRDHVEIYGFDYVLQRQRQQLAAIKQYNQSQGRNRSIGRNTLIRRLRNEDLQYFGASLPPDEDERWYWYHSSSGALHY